MRNGVDDVVLPDLAAGWYPPGVSPRGGYRDGTAGPSGRRSSELLNDGSSRLLTTYTLPKYSIVFVTGDNPRARAVIFTPAFERPRLYRAAGEICPTTPAASCSARAIRLYPRSCRRPSRRWPKRANCAGSMRNGF